AAFGAVPAAICPGAPLCRGTADAGRASRARVRLDRRQRGAVPRRAQGTLMSADAWDRGPSDPRRAFELLNRHGVDFTVIGGIAVIAHGHPRNTRDIDFVAATDRTNLARLAAALRELDAELWGVDADLLGIEIDAET